MTKITSNKHLSLWVFRIETPELLSFTEGRFCHKQSSLSLYSAESAAGHGVMGG